MSEDSTKSTYFGVATGRIQQQLMPGDVLAGRFTVIQFVARGGMGEVYEVADQYFQNRHFALKTLREEIANDAGILRYFEREVLLAREVRHDNICPVFDLFHVDGPRGPITFLTMKLLQGESLATCLSRAPLNIDTALPLLRQMADGLDAAHRAGVIHRDFKPGNVMLERSGDDVRVSITDFGLSRVFRDQTHAEMRQVSGTAGYIAPEVLQGRAATPSSDVYAFGCVVYEMLTGRRPASESGKDAFVPPSALAEEIPPIWDRMVAGCLEPDPSRRFQSAGQAVEFVSGASTRPRAVPLKRPRSRTRLALAAGVAAVLVAIALWVAFPTLYRLRHPLPRQRFVALMIWPANPDADSRALLKATLDRVAARLGRAEAKSKDLMIISPGDVGGPQPRNPADAVSTLGANLVLSASLNVSHGSYDLLLKVVDAARQSVLRQREYKVPMIAIAQLPQKATEMAAFLLDVPLPSGPVTDSEELARVGPSAFQAFSSAEELVGKPNDQGLDQAIEKYQKAIELEPQFALAYARLSMAYLRKFTRTQDAAALALAVKNANQALHYNPDSAKAVLSRAMADLYSGQTAQALDGITRALRLDPGNAQILLYKAVAYRFLDRRAEEESVYREIIQQRPNYWPAYNELGGVLHRHGRDREAAEAFAEASAVAPRAALPLTNLGAMFLLLGRKSDAADAFRKSLDRAPTELAYLQLGNLEFEARDYRKALDLYLRARDLRPRNDITWRNLGDCYAMLGDRARVVDSYRHAADLLAESLQTNPLRGSSWMTLAFYRAKLGERAEAERSMAEAERRGASDVQSQFKKAQVLALLGRKDEAVQLVINCMDRGLSPIEVDLALDLASVRGDRRLRNRETQLTQGINKD